MQQCISTRQCTSHRHHPTTFRTMTSNRSSNNQYSLDWTANDQQYPQGHVDQNYPGYFPVDPSMGYLQQPQYYEAHQRSAMRAQPPQQQYHSDVVSNEMMNAQYAMVPPNPTHSNVRNPAVAFPQHALPAMPTPSSSSPGHPTQLVRCTWKGGCGHSLDDVTPSGIMRHLKEFHFNTPLNPWNNKARGPCLWISNCRSDDMNYESLGKHIAQVHLKSTVMICPHCGGKFARSDALLRHLRENCEG